MNVIITLILSGLAVAISSYIIPGVHVDNFFVAVVVAVVLGIITALVKPLLLIVTLPINLLTLGLFTFVINAVLVLLASMVVPGFTVDGFLPALLFSIVVSVVGSALGMLNQK